jgi:hypothetical protein
MDRYWVGGTGTWNSTNTANWSSASGGPGGASVPTATDNVYFDGGSDLGSGFTITIGDNVSCKDWIVGDGTIVTPLAVSATLSGSTTTSISVYGSLYFPATNFISPLDYYGRLFFRSTNTGNTITTNGVIWGGSNGNFTPQGITFDGVGGEWSLGSALTIRGVLFLQSLEFTNGTFNTNNFDVTTSVFRTNTGTKTINLGSSTVTYNRGSTQGWNVSSTGLTFNAGTSTIVSTFNGSSGNANEFIGGGLQYYNLIFASTGQIASRIFGTNTFNNLTFVTRAASGIGSITFSNNQTINGILSIHSGSTNPTSRVLIVSNAVGVPNTLTIATASLGLGVDFRDINISGSPLLAIGAGDCGGNTNIIFDAPKNVYRRGTGNWSDNQWALTSSGSVTSSAFPLIQDTIFFDGNTTSGTHTINANYNIGHLNLSNSPNITLSTGTTTPLLYGDVILNNNVTLSGTGTITFSGRSLQNILSSGVTFAQPLNISKFNSVNLLDALTCNNSLTLTVGELILNNYTATATTFSSNNSNSRFISFGDAGKIVLTGTGTLLSMNTATNFTYAGTGLFESTHTGGGARGFAFGAAGGNEANAPSLNILGGSGSMGIGNTASPYHYKNINFNLSTGILNGRAVSIYGNVDFGNLTQTDTIYSMNFIKSSGIQTLTGNNFTLQQTFTKGELGTLKLLSNFSVGRGQSGQLLHSAGTIDLNGYKLTVQAQYNISNSTPRTINFGNRGVIELTQTGSAFNAGTSVYLETNGIGTISMVASGSKTFVGGGANYRGVTLNQGGSGSLVITGNNSFKRIANTAAPTTIQITGGTTQSVEFFDIKGTPTSPVIVDSTTTTNFQLNSLITVPQVVQSTIVSRSVATPPNSWYGDMYSTGSNTTNWQFLTANRPEYRVSQTGLQTDRGMSSELNEISGSIIRMGIDNFYAGEFDEVTPITVPMRYNNNTVQISGSIDETSIIF